MPRGKQVPKRTIAPDPKYNSLLLAKFINMLMEDGKKTIAQKIVYDALEQMAAKKKGEALTLFEQVLEALRPSVEVRSRRVGGANYQVPMPVNVNRQNTLAFRWLIKAAKDRKGQSMTKCLTGEMLDALEETGGAMKKKDDVHRMAEANKAFAHFARRGFGRR